MKYIIEYTDKFYTSCVENGKKLVSDKAYVTNCNIQLGIVVYDTNRSKAKKYKKSSVERIMRLIKQMHSHNYRKKFKIIEVEE